MPKKVIRPCIRGLRRFEKYGCPEKHFDPATGEGCPAWKEYTIPGAPGEMPNIIKDCIDCLSEYWRFESLKLLEGNQVATESLRNGLCEEGAGGFVGPKPNRDVLALAVAINAENKTLKAFIQNQNIVGITG